MPNLVKIIIEKLVSYVLSYILTSDVMDAMEKKVKEWIVGELYDLSKKTPTDVDNSLVEALAKAWGVQIPL